MISLQRRGIVEEYKGYQFRRESMAQDSQGKLIYPHNARFEQGPFGSDKGILVEEGTTNLLTNPFFISGLSGWSKQIFYPGDNAIYFTDGVAVIKAVNDRPGLYQNVNLDVGTIVTVSILIKRTSGSIAPRLRWGGGPVIGEIEISENGQWVKYSATTDVQGNRNLIIEPSIAGQAEYEIKAVQLEQKPYATTFTPSVRADEEIIIPTAGLLSPEQGTIEFDFKIPISPTETGMYCYLLRDFYIHSANEYFYFSRIGAPRFRVRSPINKWNRLALVFENNDLNTVVLFLNGNRYEIAEVSPDNTSLPDWWTTINIPARVGSNSAATKYISNLRLSSIARTQEQLAPLDRPPEVDEYTTLYLPFNGPDNVRAAKVVTL